MGGDRHRKDQSALIGVWVLAAGVLAIDVLVIRWAQIEYRRYRFRKKLNDMIADLNRISSLIGEALMPVVQDLAYQVDVLARRWREGRG